MVWLAQIAVTQAWTQRGPQTKLTRTLLDFTGVSSEFALIEGIATGQIQLPPILAQEIFRLAVNGDQVAIRIINTSANELAENVNAVIRQLNLEDDIFDLVMIGSIFNAGEIFLNPFRETVHAYAPRAKLVRLSVPPVVGAVLLATGHLKLTDQLFRQALVQSIHKIWVVETKQNIDIL